jgi:hypothetical protein
VVTTRTTYREIALLATWVLALLACWAGFTVYRSITEQHPAARVQRGTLAADLVETAGRPTVERPYEKSPGETDVCGGDPNVVKALEYVHPRNDGLRGMVQRWVVEHASLITVCVDGAGRVTSSHLVQF